MENLVQFVLKFVPKFNLNDNISRQYQNLYDIYLITEYFEFFEFFKNRI